jgi:hypothetical protein
MNILTPFQRNAIMRAAALIGTSTFRSIGALGTNIEWVNSTNANRIHTNAFYNGARMNQLGLPGTNAPRDATTGWPTTAFYVCLSSSLTNGTTLFDGAVPPGTYTWSYTYPTGSPVVLTLQSSGSNTPNCVGISGLTFGATTSSGGFTTQPFTFTLAPQGTLTLSFDGPISGPIPCDCPIDGQATTAGQPMFRDEALASYSQYATLRTLDVLNGGGRQDILWSDRPPNYTGPQIAQDIPSWERVIALMLAIKNYPGSKLKKWKVNLPPFSDPTSYAAPLAALFTAQGVPAGFAQFEYGNEPFNFSGTNSTRWHGWENAAFNTVNGIANYDLLANAGAPSALYRSPGQTLSSMSITTAGLCTVTLSVACSSLLDLTGNPYIVNGASIIVSAAAPIFNAAGLAADISRTMTVSNVSGNTFQYSTGVSGAGSTAPGSTQIFFKPTSSLLADNLSFSANSMQKKWWMNQLFAFRSAWQAVRPKATYHDEWYLNIQPIGGAIPPAANKTRVFEFPYATYLGGGTASSWVDEITTATYSAPAGTVAAEADLYNPAMSTSLYAGLNDPTVGQTVDNQCRGLVYQCLVYGIKPSTYEGGVALQTTSSAAFVVASSTNPLMETYLTAHQRVVLRNGVAVFMNFNSSPRIYGNGSSGNSSWQSMQYFSDSVNAGDSNYSAKKAALEKFDDPVFYTNINGNDLTSLEVGQYQNATVLTGNDIFSTGINATNSALYWGTGGTALNRNVDWVYCNNTFTPRQVFVDGTDSQATAVQVWVYPPDLSGPVQIGTVHLPTNGITNAGTGSTVGPCPDPIIWTPTLAGPYVVRLIMVAGAGTGPGIRRVRFV